MKLIITFASIALLSISCSERDTTAAESSAETVEATAATPYPLDVCIVSGEKLGSMGEPVVIIHEGREIKFCCAECEPTFKEDPEKYLSKLDGES